MIKHEHKFHLEPIVVEAGHLWKYVSACDCGELKHTFVYKSVEDVAAASMENALYLLGLNA
jgi:hypothetical protein